MALYNQTVMNIRNASKISIILSMIVVTYVSIWITFAGNIINFSEYQKNVATIKNKDISKTKAIQQIMSAKDMDCGYTWESKDTYIVSASCLLKNDLPKIGFQEAIDYLRPYIESFNTVYNDMNQRFSYQWTAPIFSRNYEILPKTLEENLVLIHLQDTGKRLRIHKSSLAYQVIKQANFFTVYKDTSILKRCTKQNYTVALNQIKDRILWAGETLNLNKEIMNIKWYCKWAGAQDLLFYGWVCGFATQLFRTSLLVPTVEITKRYPHNERLVPYYSEYIFGDDAALYQMSKQLEIKNAWVNEIYFKVLDKRNGNYFVIITPEKNDQWVTIKKTQTKELWWKVQREIYERNPDMVIKTDSFVSNYIKKTYTTN